MRKSGWLVCGLLALGMMVVVPPAPSPSANAAAAGRPNIVVVMMDDMRWDELRFAPRVGRYITNRGLRFANSFSPLPLCCPARASFLLGQYAHNHKVLTVKKPYGFGALNDSRTVATRLRSSGYQTGMVGKYLNGYGRMRSRVTGKASMLYKPAGWTDWMASLETNWPRGSRYSGGTYNYQSFTQNINRRVVMHRGQYSSNVIGGQAAGLIGKYHRNAAPFFLWVTPVAPHAGGPREKRDPPHLPQGQRVRAGVPDPLHAGVGSWAVRPDGDACTRSSSDAGQPSATSPTSRPPSGTTSRTRGPRSSGCARVERQRAEAIYAWDVQFGRMISALKRTGEYANTVLVFTSDNGYYMGEHRHPAGKVTHHEVSSRVPLVVAGPGVKRGVRYSPAMTHDLTATILDIANAAPLPGHGRDLALARDDRC